MGRSGQLGRAGFGHTLGSSQVGKQESYIVEKGTKLICSKKMHFDLGLRQ